MKTIKMYYTYEIAKEEIQLILKEKKRCVNLCNLETGKSFVFMEDL